MTPMVRPVERTPSSAAILDRLGGELLVGAELAFHLRDRAPREHQFATTGQAPNCRAIAPVGPPRSREPKPKPLQLTDDYVKTGSAEDFLQIRKAGVRLAAVLNKALQ